MDFTEVIKKLKPATDEEIAEILHEIFNAGVKAGREEN